MPLEIRTASVEDVAAIVGILISSKQNSLPELLDKHDLDSDFWTERWRRYLTSGSEAQMARGDGFALIAQRSGTPIGFAGYHHTRRHGADVELESLYVLKEVQREGIGSALLRTVASRVVVDGDRSMCVGYNPKNPYKRFYLKHGAAEINPHWAMWRNLASLTL